MGIFGCKHKFGKVQSCGFQYCEHCGFARQPKQNPCQHKWRDKHTLEKGNELLGCCEFIYVLQCEHCGDIKTKRVGTGRNHL